MLQWTTKYHLRRLYYAGYWSTHQCTRPKVVNDAYIFGDALYAQAASFERVDFKDEESSIFGAEHIRNGWAPCPAL